MKDIKNIIAKNISELRQKNHMTQLELAEKLNYSDKTISKWERAESSPDISILVEIAELFGVSLDYLVTEEHELPVACEPTETDPSDAVPSQAETTRINRRAISNLSESCAWIIAVFAFVITTLILKQVSFQFLYFVYALPIALIVRLVFNSIWFNKRHNYYIISLLMWALLAGIHITFWYFGHNVALVYLLGVAGQIAIILWSHIKRPKKNK